MDIPLERSILDNLPFGVTMQNLDFDMTFQNKFSQEMFGCGEHGKCYTRWKEYEEYGDGMCKDCMTRITKVDKESHSIVRRMVKKDGKELIVKIIHKPIIDENGEFKGGDVGPELAFCMLLLLLIETFWA